VLGMDVKCLNAVKKGEIGVDCARTEGVGVVKEAATGTVDAGKFLNALAEVFKQLGDVLGVKTVEKVVVIVARQTDLCTEDDVDADLVADGLCLKVVAEPEFGGTAHTEVEVVGQADGGVSKLLVELCKLSRGDLTAVADGVCVGMKLGLVGIGLAYGGGYIVYRFTHNINCFRQVYRGYYTT